MAEYKLRPTYPHILQSLSRILNNRSICRLCNLLVQAICQDEYDILQADHIKDSLPDNPRFKEMARFSDWVGKNNNWKREWVGGAGLWPLGYAINRSSAAHSNSAGCKETFHRSRRPRYEFEQCQGYVRAADSSDANAGLKGTRADPARRKQIIEDGIIINARMFLPIKMAMDFQQWEERAWCFQDMVLSRRLLVTS